MEDFVSRDIVTRAAFPEFRKSWKDPEFFMCVFVYTPSKCAFLYMPYDPPSEVGDEEPD